MAVAFATLLTLLAAQQAAVLAIDSPWGHHHHHHHHKAPTVVDVVRYGQACPCAKTLPFELEVPVKPRDPALRTYGYAVEAPPPRERLPLYSYDYQLEVPVKKHPHIKRTYGYEVQAPPARQPLPLYSYDYELEIPHKSSEPKKLHGLETRLERVLLPKHDCPWHGQAGALLRHPRHDHGYGYGLVEPDEEPGAGRVVPLAGPTRILPTSGPALPPQEEFYDSGKTYQVVHSSPLALISGGDGGRLGFYPEDLVGLKEPWSPLPGPAYLAGSVLGRDFRTDLHFAPERPHVDDEPPAGRYLANNRYARESVDQLQPQSELEADAQHGRRSRRAVSLRFTLSEGYESLEEEEDAFVLKPGRQWRGKYVTDRVGHTRGPQYAWKGSKEPRIVDPDDLDDLAFRHPLDRYFTNVRDWKDVVDFNSKVLGSGNIRHGYVKSPRVPWWRQSRPSVGPIYRPPSTPSPVVNTFIQEASESHLTPAPKALPKSVYSLKILPDAAYDEGNKIAPIRPNTVSQVGSKGTYEKIVYDEDYSRDQFDSENAGNGLRNRFNSRFQDERFSSRNTNGFSHVLVPYFGRLGAYSLGPFVTAETGSGLSNMRDSLTRQDLFSKQSLLDDQSDDDFSLDEVDRQLLEEDRKAASKKFDSSDLELSDVASKPLPSDVYSLKILPDPVVNDDFSLEEIDKVQMMSLAEENSQLVGNKFASDLVPLRNLRISDKLNELPKNDIIPGSNNFASFNTLPSNNVHPTSKIVTSVSPDLLSPLPNPFANFAPSVVSDNNYDLNTMTRFVSGKVNQLDTFNNLLYDEFHLLERGPEKFMEKKNVKELNTRENFEDVYRVLVDHSEAVSKSSEEEAELIPQSDDVATVAGADTMTDALTDTINYELEGKEVIQFPTSESEDAVIKDAEEELKHVDSLLGNSPTENVESLDEENTFMEEETAKVADVLLASSIENTREQQKDVLGHMGQEEADIIDNVSSSEPELLGTADNPAIALVEELGNAQQVGSSSVESIGQQKALDTLPLSQQELVMLPAGQLLTREEDLGTQLLETEIVPLEGWHRDSRDWNLDGHHHEIDEVEVGENTQNQPWYGLWYGHGNEVKSVGLPKLYQLHDAILEKNKHDGNKVDAEQEPGSISPVQTTESTLNAVDNEQKVQSEDNPVIDVSTNPQETETKSPEAVLDYYSAPVSAEKVHRLDVKKDESEVHDEKWASSHNPKKASIEVNTEDSLSTASPTTSSTSHTEQLWAYPEQGFNHPGEKWTTVSVQQPWSYHFSKSDPLTQPSHEVGAEQEIQLEDNPVIGVSTNPQETETKSPQAVLDYYSAPVSAEKVHRLDVTKDESEVHDEEWASSHNPKKASIEVNTEDSLSTASPTTSSTSHTEQLWAYPEQGFNHPGEKWTTVSVQQPWSYHFSKSDPLTQPINAPKFSFVRGNPKYYLQYPNSVPTWELRRSNGGPYIQRPDRPLHNVHDDSYVNIDPKTIVLPTFEATKVDPTARYIQQFWHAPDNIQPYWQGNIMSTMNNQLRSHNQQHPPQIFSSTVRPVDTMPVLQMENSN